MDGWFVWGEIESEGMGFGGEGFCLSTSLSLFESPMDLSESYRSYEVTWFMDDALPGLGFQRGRGGAKRDPCD
jgi:hypothetical protein